MSFTAIVPARSGSKRLPHKNIKMLGNLPLFVWSLKACVESESIDKVLFSTDSEEYWSIAQRYINSDKLSLDMRTHEEAGDTVKIFDYLKSKNQTLFLDKQGYFVLCLPTMPFRNKSDIDLAIDLSKKLKKPIFSAVEYDFSISFAFRLDQNISWSPLFENSPLLTGNTRSQDQPVAYHPNGAIYVRSIADLSKHGVKTLYQDAAPYIMDREKSVDIDNESDFKKAEAMIQYLNL